MLVFIEGDTDTFSKQLLYVKAGALVKTGSLYLRDILNAYTSVDEQTINQILTTLDIGEEYFKDKLVANTAKKYMDELLLLFNNKLFEKILQNIQHSKISEEIWNPKNHDSNSIKNTFKQLNNNLSIIKGNLNEIGLDDILDDKPFIANEEKKYNNRYLPKKATSSFFPKNWSITRLQEEIALVYDDIVRSGGNFSNPPFKYIRANSEGTFDILIEVDKLGNIVNTY